MAEQRCTWINVVPTIISYLLEGEAPRARCACAESASAARPRPRCRPSTIVRSSSKFGIGIIETMGLTETVAPAFSNPLEPAQRKVGSVGRASGCEARVVDAAGAAAADGTTGEIAIRGPQVMRGYYKNDEATRGVVLPRTAGCAPATSAIATPTASSSSPAASRS